MDQETISPGRRRGVGVTGEAIDRMRELIASGEWGPGTRLPREADLAKQLGLSRNSLREAVRALSLARVLEVRQGDGTFVSSLEPEELLAPALSATHLLRGRTVLELFEVRRMLEPEAAATPTSPERQHSSTSRTTRPGCASTSDPPTTCRSTVRELGRLGLGTAPLGGLYDAVGDETAHAVVARAWEHGIRYFDTAPYYGSGLAEERLGAALCGRPRDGYV